MFSKKTSVDIAFYDISYSMLYFSIAQKFVDFVIFTFKGFGELRWFEKSWNMEFTECDVLSTNNCALTM